MTPVGLCEYFCYDEVITVGRLVGFIGPQSSWLTSPALCGGCQLFISGTWSQGSWLQSPMGPGASAVSLVGMARLQKTPGLLPTHWWVKPGPVVNAGLLTGRAGSWSLAAGPRDPRELMRGAGS